ncbi:MAG: alpha/beta fold hydrolase [Chloroflexi bacterium]|nr:alpha/beta fold hydrolase [Chloroflexota bacterium]
MTFDPEPGLTLAGTLCLPEDASARRRVPAIALFGGTGGDTRDGDMAPERTPYVRDPPKRGLQRRIAHDLAMHGIATLRFDKRGCGESGGRADLSDYETDLVDNVAAVRWLRERAEIDSGRVGACGHSAGAFNACMVARELPDIACAGLLGALSSAIEDLVRWNWARVRERWGSFSGEQRAWLRANRPREVVGAFREEEFIAAARRGDRTVRLEAEDVAVEVDLVRFRQDMERPVVHELRNVRCPALVLHGGDDMNVRVEDALVTYRALRDAGNRDVDLVIIPAVDHSFQPVVGDPVARIWDRVTLATFGRPVSPLALRTISGWAARVLDATVPPRESA